jgi:hypothetical protein
VGLIEVALYIKSAFLVRPIGYDVKINVILPRMNFALGTHVLNFVSELILDHLTLLDVGDGLVVH